MGSARTQGVRTHTHTHTWSKIRFPQQILSYTHPNDDMNAVPSEVECEWKSCGRVWRGVFSGYASDPPETKERRCTLSDGNNN